MKNTINRNKNLKKLVHFLLFISKFLKKGVRMQKVFILFIFLKVSVFGLYNPFFTELKPPKEPAKEKVVVIKEHIKSDTPLQKISIQYIGYIETKKGKFALVNFDGHTIVVTKNDPLYSGTQVFQVAKLTTNYMLIRDPNKKIQTIYFSTEGTNTGVNGVN